ncbi:hypothetical protein HanPI659440_Chr09g0337981 [Helianthus annuus]|nr:hypothetical protein HanPI659440_Chr09g0337981 [Helianthus annuus]
MIRVQNFEYTFRALGIEPLVEDFRHFYQLTMQLGFFSFRVRKGAPKLMSPPKGMTKWKTKFFYVKAAAVTAKLQFRNVTRPIATENLSTLKAGQQAWFSRLRVIGSTKLDNRQLWILRMMVGGRLDRKARPVLREKNEDRLAVEAPLWRMFCPDFEGKIEILKCGPDDHLGALGDSNATGVPKVVADKFGDKQRRKKKTHEAVSFPPLVPKTSCILRTRLRKYEDYVVVSDTLEGLGVTGGSSGAGGVTTGNKPVDKKRKADASVAGGEKTPKFRKTRAPAVPNQKPAVSAETLEETVPVTTTPSSPLKIVDVESQNKGGEDTSIEVVSSEGTPPTMHAEQASKKTSGDTIFDTLDLSDNLIDPRGDGDKGGEKPKSTIFKKVSGSTAAGKGGDDVMNDPSACRETLRGLGTPVETALAHGLSRQNLQSQPASMLVGGSIIANAVMEDYNILARREDETIRLRAQAEAMMKAAQEGMEQLEKDKAAFAKLKTVAEAAIKEADTRGATALKEAEARAAQELANVNADRTKLNKVVEELQIVETILDAPENATTVADVNELARQAGFKAGYNKCLGDVNPFFTSKFTDEWSGFHGVDTEAAYDAAVDAYNRLSIPALDRIEKCLEAENYVDRLRMLFEPVKEDGGTSGANAE